MSGWSDGQMQRLQIGALYMFSYVSKELLEEMETLKDMLSEEETANEDELT
mgnify:FL=1